jgi:hypothetical protein
MVRSEPDADDCTNARSVEVNGFPFVTFLTRFATSRRSNLDACSCVKMLPSLGIAAGIGFGSVAGGGVAGWTGSVGSMGTLGRLLPFAGIEMRSRAQPRR